MDWGEAVIILNMWIGPQQYVDTGGRYWGVWPGSSVNRGKMRIMHNGAELAIEKERVMRYDEYMKRYKAGTLPPNAAGKPWFLEGI